MLVVAVRSAKESSQSRLLVRRVAHGECALEEQGLIDLMRARNPLA